MFLPVFDKVSEEFTGQDVDLVKIDIDKEQELAIGQGVQGVPTIIAYKNGKELARFSGFRPLEELKNFVDSHK